MRAISIQTSNPKTTYVRIYYFCTCYRLKRSESQGRVEDPFICLDLLGGVSTLGVVPQSLSLTHWVCLSVCVCVCLHFCMFFIVCLFTKMNVVGKTQENQNFSTFFTSVLLPGHVSSVFSVSCCTLVKEMKLECKSIPFHLKSLYLSILIMLLNNSQFSVN